MGSIVVDIAASPFTSLRLTELLVGFGSGSSIVLLAVMGLLVPFSEYWQRSALAALDAYPEITDTFVAFT